MKIIRAIVEFALLVALVLSVAQARAVSRATLIAKDCGAQMSDAVICSVQDIDSFVPGMVHMWLIDSRGSKHLYSSNGYTGSYSKEDQI